MIKLFIYKQLNDDKPNMVQSVVWIEGTDFIISSSEIEEGLGIKNFLSRHAVDPDNVALVTSLQKQYLDSYGMPPFVYRISTEGTF